MAGGVNLKIKFNADKEVEGFVKKLKDGLSGAQSVIDNFSKSIENGLKKASISAEELLDNISKSADSEGIDRIIFAIKALEKGFRDGTISQEEYAEGIENITKKYQDLAYQADLTNKKLKPTNQFTDTQREDIVNRNISQRDIESFNLPQLQQALVILENQKQVVGTTGKELQEIVDLQDAIGLQLKNINLSTRQKNELTEKQRRLEEKSTEKSKAAANASERDLKAQERKTAQLERQAIAQRRADGDKQYEFAMGMEAKTLEQMVAKTKELEFARKKLDSTTKDGQANIASVNKEMERLKIQQDAVLKSGLNLADANGKTSRSFRELAQMAGAYFSVYAVRNFATEVANVTGEFDLQRKALQALLQDRVAADAIFEKIKAQAIQSPFSVMQLTAATKQLAAYRIEADNLFDTTMMLSDVSAGLGVDMERLILAFGQVKAATVLRGQEVRQFTEAGIPVISLLADKFGELEGRVVSTGEVFDKISNRLVPFEMINEIFKDMTASGGMFYEMQKLQAETIKGRLVNLTDAYQLFLDKMGTANSGIIKGFIGGLEAILRNMDSILPVLKGLIAGFITYKTVVLSMNLFTKINTILTSLNTAAKIANLVVTKQLTRSQVEATAAQNGLNNKLLISLAKNPYAALAAAAIGLATAIGLAVYNAGKFNREIEKIETTGIQDYNRLTNTFKNLVGVMRDTTKSLEEQNDAYEELNRTFKDILPQKYLEEQYLRSTALAYDEVTAAIYNNIKAKVNEQKLIALEENVGAKVAETEKQAVKKLMQNTNISEGQALGYIVKLKEAIDKDKLNFEQAKEYTLKLFNITTEEYYKYYASLSPFLENYTRFSRNFREITQDTFAEAETSFIEFGERLGRLRDVTTSETKKFIDLMKKSTSSENFIVWFNRVNEQFKSSLRQIMAEPASAQRNVLYEQVEQERKKFLADYNETAKIVIRIGELSKQFGISSNTLMSSLRKQDEGRSDWGSRVLEDIATREKQVEMYNIASEANKKSIIQDIDSYTKEISALKQFAKEQGFVEKSNKSASDSKDPLLNAIKEEISLIEKLTSEYQKLIKEGVKSDVARTTVADNFKSNMDSINKILSSQGVKTIDFASLIQSDDPKAFLNILEEQFNTIQNNPEVSKLLDASIGEVKTKIKIEELDKTENEIKTFLEDIKKKYEISLEINEAQQGTRDLLMKMFGINENDIIKDIGTLIDKVNEEIGKRLGEQGVETISKDFASLTTEQFNALLEPFKSKEGYGDIAKGLIDLFQYLQDTQKKYIDTTVKAYTVLVKEYGDYKQRIIDIEDKKNKEIQTLDDQYFLSKLEKDEKYYILKEAIEKRASEGISQVMFENIKDTELWALTFDNLEKVGDRALQFLFDSLTKYSKGAGKNLPINQFKDLMKQIEKLDEQIKKRNPFKALIDSFSGYQSAMSNVENATNTVNTAQEIYNSNVERFGEESSLTKTSLEALKKAFENLASAESDAQKNGYFINQTIQQISSDTRKYVTSAQDLYTSLLDLGQAFGFVGDSTEEFEKNMNSLVENQLKTLDGVAEIIGGFYTDNVGMIINGFASAAAGTYKSIVNAIDLWGKDAKINEGIDETTKSIDKMNDSIRRLQNSVDKQLGSDWLAGMNKIAEGYAQIAEDIQAKIVAEKGKKNPDDDVLYQYEQDLLDAEDNYKETVERMVEELTGADLKSAAEDFASIWLDAFLQGEDAMAAIEDRFDQMIKNMVVKAIASKIVAGILQKTFDAVEAAVDDGDVTQAEIDRINAEGEYAMTLINEKLGALGGWFRDLLGTGGTAETLQKGIQGITEQTAGIIEGYLNTIRYEIFRHTGILQSIQTQMQLNNNINSDILYQATLSYQVLVAIRDWQNSITTTDNGLPAIRVV